MAVSAFSAPPLPPPAVHGHQLPPVMGQSIRMASPVRIRPVVPVFAAPPPAPANTPLIPVQVKESPPVVAASRAAKPLVGKGENVDGGAVKDLEESTVMESLKQLEI